jgi:NTE family protein
LVGTSVGAINGAFLAGAHHEAADEAAAGLLSRWREVTKGGVVRPILARQVPLTALRYAGEIISLPGVRLPSLLDPRPLEANLRRWVDWPAVRRNVDDRRLDSIAVIATAARSGRSVGFCDGCFERELRRSHVIDYVRARLAVEHVRASAAIPILFPPVRIESPREARGWYYDGGTRLNTPLKPALDLGADRIVVVSTESIATPSTDDGRHDCEPPDFGDGALHMLQGALVDPLVEDLRMLGDVNRLLGGESPTHGELLSYLFFDPQFIEALIELGRSDADRWLRLPPGPDRPWQVEPLDAFVKPQPSIPQVEEGEVG